MVARLLFILALLHAKTDAVLEVARSRQTQPKAIRIAPPDSPTTDTRGGAVAAWHAERKNAITRKLGADVIAKLEAPTPADPRLSRRRRRFADWSRDRHAPLDGLWWLGFAPTWAPTARSRSSRCCTTSCMGAPTTRANRSVKGENDGNKF